MIYNSVLVRFSGEYGVKSPQTQELLESLLRRNLQNTLKVVNKGNLFDRLQVLARSGRYYLVPRQPTAEDIPALVSIAGRTFGVGSISPCFQTPLKDATSARTVPAKMMLAHGLYPSKISIRGPKVPGIDYTEWKADIFALCEKFSQEELGNVRGKRSPSQGRFQTNVAWDIGPWTCQREKKLEIEIFNKNAYISAERIKGPGGFPLGLEDPLVALVSGGFDSPVAAWMALRRGAPLIFVIMDPSRDTTQCDTTPGGTVKEKALGEVQILSEYMHGLPTRPLVFIVPYGKALESLQARGATVGVTCLLCKRTMYRIAEQVALEYGAKGIVTGEILGEQASQTAQNLMVLNRAVTLPVHRPLFGFDKEEVIHWSRNIGVAPIASVSSAPCWGVPERPQVRGELELIEEIEKKEDVDQLVDQCMQLMYPWELK